MRRLEKDPRVRTKAKYVHIYLLHSSCCQIHHPFAIIYYIVQSLNPHFHWKHGLPRIPDRNRTRHPTHESPLPDDSQSCDSQSSDVASMDTWPKEQARPWQRQQQRQQQDRSNRSLQRWWKCSSTRSQCGNAAAKEIAVMLWATEGKVRNTLHELMQCTRFCLCWIGSFRARRCVICTLPFPAPTVCSSTARIPTFEYLTSKALRCICRSKKKRGERMALESQLNKFDKIW